MGLDVAQLSQLQSPFYRVAVKALIFDDEKRLLLVRNPDHDWELPGGGWEHDETPEAGLARELQEELGVELSAVPELSFTYRGVSRWGWHVLRLAMRATVNSFDFTPGDGMQAVRFVTKEELLLLNFANGDRK